MKAEITEAQITLWFRAILLMGMFTILLAFGRSIIQNKELNDKFTAYRNNSEQTIGELNESLNNTLESVKTYSSYQKEVACLAMNIYFEAASESYEGMLAVAQVTKNRVDSKAYPKTYCAVVYEKSGRVCQFSWTCDGAPDRINSQKMYNKATKIAEEVLLTNKKSGIIGSNVMNYHANYVEPNWSKEKQLVATIGNHLFYGNRINYGE